MALRTLEQMPEPIPAAEGAGFAVTLVVPLYNEAGYAPAALGSFLPDLPADVEVLLVENGSTDGTAVSLEAFLDPPRVRLLQLPVANYGGALRAGLEAATAPVVVNEDVDLLDPVFVQQARAELATADVLVASKRTKGAVDERPLSRRLVTAGFGILLRMLFGLRTTDTHGMKAFRRDAALALLPVVRGGHDTFDTELIIRAERAGLKVAEVPAVVKEERATRSGSVLRRVPRTLVRLAVLRWRLWRERSPTRPAV